MQHISKMIAKNAEAAVAAKALQSEGHLGLRDLRSLGQERLQTARAMAEKKSRKSKIERQKEELMGKLGYDAGSDEDEEESKAGR